jgi:hypothetical protein
VPSVDPVDLCDRLLADAVAILAQRPDLPTAKRSSPAGAWIGYPGARRRGLPIGSGATEATCKTLFTVRMKRSGARWKEQTARDVINLRALALSDRWNAALHLTFAPLRKAVRVAA